LKVRLRASAFRVLILHISGRNTLFLVRRATGGDVMGIGSLAFRLEGVSGALKGRPAAADGLRVFHHTAFR